MEWIMNGILLGKVGQLFQPIVLLGLWFFFSFLRISHHLILCHCSCMTVA